MILGNASLTLGRIGDVGSSSRAPLSASISALILPLPPNLLFLFLPLISSSILPLPFSASGEPGAGELGRDAGGVASAPDGIAKKSKTSLLGSRAEGEEGGDSGAGGGRRE